MPNANVTTAAANLAVKSLPGWKMSGIPVFGISLQVVERSHDQAGEFSFYKNTEQYHDYDSGSWKWINDPDAGDLEDEFVVVTGKIEGRNREDVEELVEVLGGTYQSSVNKKTTVLVIGTKPGKSKVAKAQELGIRMIKEETFQEMTEDY